MDRAVTTEEATGRIRITKIPDGEAPLEVRKAWVGLELPCYPICGAAGLEQGVTTGKDHIGRCGFSVPQGEAIRILATKDSHAANWWRRHGFPQKDKAFCFNHTEAVILSGVTFQRIRRYDEEMMGDPNR